MGTLPSMHLTKIAMVVEYHGARYHGFQLQPLSPTVQEALEEAIYRLTGEHLRVVCASRTDAGVHALAQVVSFRTGAPYPPETFIRALNHFLPGDVAIKQAYRIPMDYNVQAKALSRDYRYVFLNRRTPSPFLRDRSLCVPQEVNIERMNEAASLLPGRRDFAPFCSTMLQKGRSTIRLLKRAEFRRKPGDMIVFEVEGQSFLPQQVRRMAGALLQVGLGRTSVAEFQAVAASQELGAAGPTLPPQGLFLTAIHYTDFPPPPAAQDNRTAGLTHEPSNQDLHSQSR